VLIQKGGVTRNIDEKRLHEYKVKGYARVEAKAPPGEKLPKTPKAKE
jgi:hypothetical protein